MTERRFVTLMAILSAICLLFVTGAAGSTTNDTAAMVTADKPDPHPVLCWEYGKTISDRGEISSSYYCALSQMIDCRPGDTEANAVLEIVRVSSDINNSKTHIKVLCVGNSLSQDCVAYMPFIAQGLTDLVGITLGIAYHRGAGIDDYIDFFNNNSESITYNKKSPDEDEWTLTQNQTIRQVLADEKWDIVTFQQKSGRQEVWESYANVNELIHDVIDYIGAIHDKDVCVGWLMPQIRSKTATDSSFDDMVKCVQKVLETTPVSFVIPCGTAIHYARQTDLSDIGDGGDLTHDGVHLQEGLPCLLAAYVTTMKVLEISGVEYAPIFGDQTRPVQEWVKAHHIPGQNGKSVGVTEQNCYMAQELANLAIMYPFGERQQAMASEQSKRRTGNQ